MHPATKLVTERAALVAKINTGKYSAGYEQKLWKKVFALEDKLKDLGVW